MAETLVVLMGTQVAGTLTRLANNLLRFEYDTEYAGSRAATPLSLSMPLAVRIHVDSAARRTVSNFLWGLLPDNELVLDRWARHYQVRATSPFFLLGTPVGQDCTGAVAFCQPADLSRHLERIGAVEWLTEADVADLLRELRRDRTAWLGRDFGGQFSLAGAQAKTALLFENDRWGRPSGARPTTHILKPASAGWSDQADAKYENAGGPSALLLNRSEVRLAPLYDISSILPCLGDRNPDGEVLNERQMRMAMKVGGEYKLVPPRNTWPAAAADLGLPADALVDRVGSLAAAAPSAFAAAAAEPSVAGLHSDVIARLVDRVADRASRCAAALE